jgi:hypothetical protein
VRLPSIILPHEQEIHLICAECGTFSEDDGEGWRAYTAGGLEGEEDPDPFVVYLPCVR